MCFYHDKYVKKARKCAGPCSIPSWRDRLIPLQFGNRCFEWSFRLAAVDQPLLGADFLRAFNLLADMGGEQIFRRFIFTSNLIFNLPTS